MRCDQKVALVTGGAAGLGKAIARRLKAEGARVVITDVQAHAGEATAAEYGFTFLEQDVCDEPRWTQVIEAIEERFGRLNVLINNAGILGPQEASSPQNTRLADWKRIFSVNVDGVFLGCRAGIAALGRAGGGSIINISSIAGLMATPQGTAYGASKAAVRQLTKSVAQYCAQRQLNIRCNSVHPGIVRTQLWNKRSEEIATLRGVPFDQIVNEALRTIPMGDFTRDEDIAAMVAFLASDDARHITGAKLVVDGGYFNCDTFRVSSPSVATQPQEIAKRSVGP